jgi:hypothetical protein
MDWHGADAHISDSRKIKSYDELKIMDEREETN